MHDNEYIFIENTPQRSRLKKNLLSQVIIRFDFPIVLGLSNVARDDRLVTTNLSPMLTKIQESLSATLPRYRPTHSKSIAIDLKGGNSPSLTEMNPEIVHCFEDSKGSKKCEITNSCFIFHINGDQNYEDFDVFLSEFSSIWDIIKAEINAKFLNRVGIRKINSIVIPEGETLNNFLTKKIKSKFLSPYLDREEILLDFGSREILQIKDYTVMMQRGYKKEGTNRRFIFDADVWLMNCEEQKLSNDNLNYMNRIHWELFSDTICENYLAELKG